MFSLFFQFGSSHEKSSYPRRREELLPEQGTRIYNTDWGRRWHFRTHFRVSRRGRFLTGVPVGCRFRMTLIADDGSQLWPDFLGNNLVNYQWHWFEWLTTLDFMNSERISSAKCVKTIFFQHWRRIRSTIWWWGLLPHLFYSPEIRESPGHPCTNHKSKLQRSYQVGWLKPLNELKRRLCTQFLFFKASVACIQLVIPSFQC